MLNKQQIKLVQTAVRAAGLRTRFFDGRYRLLLAKYGRSSGGPVTSCKQLNNAQLDDLLAICEASGWRMPGKADDHFRTKLTRRYGIASFAQQEAIKHLAGDLGWNEYQLGGLIKRMTNGRIDAAVGLTPSQAYRIIEALKAMVGRDQGKKYANLRDVQKDMEAARDGTSQIK